MNDDLAQARRRIEAAPDERRRRPDHLPGTAAMLGQIYDAGAMPSTVPGVFSVHPTQLAGNEVEGAAVTTTAGDDSTVFTVLGPSVPAVGDVLTAYLIAGRWVSRTGVGQAQWECVVCFTARVPCPSDHPDHGATVTVTNEDDSPGGSCTTADPAIDGTDVGTCCLTVTPGLISYTIDWGVEGVDAYEGTYKACVMDLCVYLDGCLSGTHREAFLGVEITWTQGGETLGTSTTEEVTTLTGTSGKACILACPFDGPVTATWDSPAPGYAGGSFTFEVSNPATNGRGVPWFVPDSGVIAIHGSLGAGIDCVPSCCPDAETGPPRPDTMFLVCNSVPVTLTYGTAPTGEVLWWGCGTFTGVIGTAVPPDGEVGDGESTAVIFTFKCEDATAGTWTLRAYAEVRSSDDAFTRGGCEYAPTPAAGAVTFALELVYHHTLALLECSPLHWSTGAGSDPTVHGGNIFVDPILGSPSVNADVSE